MKCKGFNVRSLCSAWPENAIQMSPGPRWQARLPVTLIKHGVVQNLTLLVQGSGALSPAGENFDLQRVMQMSVQDSVPASQLLHKQYVAEL